MAILNYSGCPPPPEGLGCFGPHQQWWLFNVPLKAYPYLILFSLLGAAIAFSIILLLNKKTRRDIPSRKMLMFSIIVFALILIIQIIFLSLFYRSIVY